MSSRKRPQQCDARAHTVAGTLPVHPGPSGLTPRPHSPHSCHQKCGRKSSLHFPGDVFATPERPGGSPAQGPMPYLDDDIPLLNVEEEPGKFGAGLPC